MADVARDRAGAWDAAIASRWTEKPEGRLRRWLNPSQLILLAVVVVLLWQVAVPIFMIVWGSFQDGSPGRGGFWDLTFTFENFVRAYSDPIFWPATMNSLMFATGAATLASVVGTFVAWVVERTNTPFRKIIFVLALSRMILPGILTTVAWVLLLSPRSGWVNIALMSLPFIDSPVIDVYSMGGMIWIAGVDMIPTSFLLMAAALRSTDPSLEEAGSVAGSSHFKTFFRVTLPLMRPAVFAVFFLAFVRGMEMFEVPALVGYPVGIDTYSTQVYYRTAIAPVDYGLVGAYAMTLLGICLFGIFLYLRATQAGKRFMTVTGKGYRPHVIDLGRWKYAIGGGTFLLLGATIGLPLLVLVWNSFFPFIQPPSWQALGNASLDQYHYALVEYPNTLLAFFNSTIISVIAGVVVGLLVAAISWIVLKTKTRGRGLLDALAFAPTAVPGLVMGLAFLWLYLSVPWGGLVYGSIWIVTLAMITVWIPFAMRVVSASMAQIHDELEEASYAAGASWLRTFRQVLLPLVSPGLIAAWLWVAVHAFRDLSTSLMLYSIDNQTIGVQIMLLYERGFYNAVCALGVVLIIILSALVIATQLIGRRFGVRTA